MLTADPQQRAPRLAKLTGILRHEASAEDRDLILSLAPVTRPRPGKAAGPTRHRVPRRRKEVIPR
jgi:hypothetical protein